MGAHFVGESVAGAAITIGCDRESSGSNASYRSGAVNFVASARFWTESRNAFILLTLAHPVRKGLLQDLAGFHEVDHRSSSECFTLSG